MPNKLYNDVHIKAVLVMLPYDADKVAGMKQLDLQINGVSATKANLSDDTHIQQRFKVGTTVSFIDADKHRVHYKLIADSDAHVKGSDYSAGHDAAAFVEVDAKGKEIKNAQGKNHIIVTFPGMNNPGNKDFKQGMAELTGGTTYQEKFFNEFVQTLAPELNKRGMKFSETEAIAHSMGDKFAMEYEARFDAKTMLIVGWDKTDAAVGAATRNVIRDNLGHTLSDAQFNKEVESKLKKMSHNVTEINADGIMHADFTPIAPETHESVFGEVSYAVKGGGHRAHFYMNQKASDLKKMPAADLKEFIRTAIAHPDRYAGDPGLEGQLYAASLGLEKMPSRNLPSKAENLFLETMQNEYGAMKDAFKADGNIDKKEEKILSSFDDKIKSLRNTLTVSDTNHADAMEKAAAAFLKVNPKTPEKGTQR